MLLAVVLFSTSAIAVPRAVFNVTGSNATTTSEDTMTNLTVTVTLDGAGTDNVTEVNFTLWALDGAGFTSIRNITTSIPAAQHANLPGGVNISNVAFMNVINKNYTQFSWTKGSASQGLFNSSVPATFSVLVNITYPNAAYKLEVSTIQGNGTRYYPVNLTVNVTALTNAYISLPATNNTNQTYADLSVIANAIDTDTAVSSILIDVYNSTGSLNRTAASLTSAASLTANFTSMLDGIYHITVTVNETNGATNSTNVTRRSVTIDTTAPSIALTKTSSTKTSIDLSVAVTDGTSGVPTAMGCTTTRGTRASTGSAQTITESGLGCGNTYEYTVTCADEAGNSGSATSSFATDNCGSSGGSSGGSSSGSDDDGIDVDADLTETSTTSVKGSQGVIKTFSVDGQTEHKVTFTTVNDNSVTLKFQSSPILVTVNEGETKKVDLDDNGSNDVEVTLDSVTSGVASITLKNLSEAVVTPPTDDTTGTDGTTPPTDDGTVPDSAEPSVPVDEGGLSTGVIIAIIVVLLLVIGAGVYFFLNRD